MNYYQHHIGDHMIATAHLSALEDGIYRRMMDRYYSTELPLPSDEAALFRVMRVHTDDERHAVRAMLDEFFTRSDAGWQHSRCEQDIAAFKDKSAKSTEAANRRWHKTDHQDAGQGDSDNPCPAKSDAPRPPETILDGVSPPAADPAIQADKPAPSESRPDAKPSTPQAKRLQADWQPSDADVAFCRTHRPDLEPMAVANQFRDYWIAQPGAAGRKVDWSATWRNWVRNERGTPAVRNPNAYSAAHATKQDKRQAIADALTGRNRLARAPTMIDLNAPPH